MKPGSKATQLIARWFHSNARTTPTSVGTLAARDLLLSLASPLITGAHSITRGTPTAGGSSVLVAGIELVDEAQQGRPFALPG